MRSLAVQNFVTSFPAELFFPDEKFRGNRSGTQLLVEFSVRGMKKELNTEETRSSQCFTIRVNRFDMPSDGTFAFIYTEYTLKALLDTPLLPVCFPDNF